MSTIVISIVILSSYTGYTYLRKPNSLHERGKARPVTGVGVGSEQQEQVQELHIQRRYEVDLRAEEVALVGVGAVFQKHPRNLQVAVADGQPQRLVAEQGPRERIISVFSVVYPCSHPKQ